MKYIEGLPYTKNTQKTREWLVTYLVKNHFYEDDSGCPCCDEFVEEKDFDRVLTYLSQETIEETKINKIQMEEYTEPCCRYKGKMITWDVISNFFWNIDHDVLVQMVYEIQKANRSDEDFPIKEA